MSKSKKKPDASGKQKEWKPAYVITAGTDKGKEVVPLSVVSDQEPEILEVGFSDGSKRIIMLKYLKAIE